MAVMPWLPTPAKVSLHDATPPISGVPTQPAMLAPPSRKVTVPVGVPLPGGFAVTVAVKVTLWPTTEGLTDEPSEVVVGSWFTVWVSGAEVLGLKVASPL